MSASNETRRVHVHDGVGPRRKLLVPIAFAAVVALLLAELLYGYFGATGARDEADAFVQNALVSVQLVDHIGTDIEHERILVDRHIFESTEVDMRPIERQLEAVWRDYEASVHDYAPLAVFPGEAAAWARLQADVAQIHADLEPVLALSRQNRDGEARRAVTALDPVFERIEREVVALIEINNAASDRALTMASEMRTRQLYTRVGVDAAIVLIVLVGGLLVARQIARAHEALEAQNRELDAFAGRVAHDLRGLIGTLGMSGALIERSKAAGIFDRTIGRMTALVDDLLQLSRAGTAPIGRVALAPVVAAVETDLAPLVQGAGGTLKIDVEPADVRGTATLLRHLLWNLGENAVKYRRADEPLALAITGHLARAGYELRVSDNGSGMSPADAAHAFEPFYRAAGARGIPGSGLGLAIARRVVEASGGTIAMSSRPGEGTTFAITLRT